MAKAKEIVVISGKGGTGKTSVLASLAVLAGRSVLADCDVDAADLHLVMAPTVREQEAFISGKEASIRQEDCIGCGACLARCRFEAIRKEGDGAGEARFSVDPLGCEGCGVCVRACPVGAIDFEPQQVGWLYCSETACGPMVHARLGAAQENSGKLVSAVRYRAGKWAEEQGIGLVLIDGSPGIGCPVIASITGASLVVAVTEPTMSGRHDLERVAALAKHFKVPLTVVINKADINHEMSGQIRDYCEKEGLPVAGVIPYDTVVTRAQMAGRAVVDFAEGAVSEAIGGLWRQVNEQLAAQEN